MDDINEWIVEQRKNKLKKFHTAVSKHFGTVIMEDGREAQVQVTLELDQDDWE